MLDYPAPLLSSPPSRHYLRLSPFAPPLSDSARSVAVGSTFSYPFLLPSPLLPRVCLSFCRCWVPHTHMSKLAHPTCTCPHCSPLCGRLLLPRSPVASLLCILRRDRHHPATACSHLHWFRLWERARSLAVHSASSPVSGDVTSLSHPVPTCSHPRCFHGSGTLRASFLSVGSTSFSLSGDATLFHRASLPCNTCSGDVTLYTFPSHPVVSSSTLTVCTASPSLDVRSLTQACRGFPIPPAPVPIAPPSVGDCCSLALPSRQYYSVEGPLFSRSCHYLIPCPLVLPVWERARAVAVGSASSLLSCDVTPHTFPSCPITTCSHPRWFRVSRTVLAPLLSCGEHVVATFQRSHSILLHFVVVQHMSARTVCCTCCSKLTLPHVCYVTTSDNE